MEGRTDVRTDVHDIMAIKPNFLTSMGYHISLPQYEKSSNDNIVNFVDKSSEREDCKSIVISQRIPQ